MAYRTFVVLLLVVADCLSFNESRRVIYDNFDGDDHLGYFIKTAKEVRDQERSRQNAVGRQGKVIESKSGLERDEPAEKGIVTSLDPREGNIEDFSVESIKNDSALPLHVTSTARQECLVGYQADENGTCQKMLAPKGEKSFKLRRRKRDQQQQQPKLSYADVLKFGRNRPLTIPFKAEILTTTQKAPEVRASTIVTTIKPIPSEAVGVTTPTVVTGKIADAGTTAGNAETVPTTTAPVKKNEPAMTTVPVVKATVNEVVTTATQTAAPASGVSTPVTPVSKAGVTTISSAAPISSATTATPSVTPANKAGVTTVPPTVKPTAGAPSPTPTKPPGLIIPTILTKIPTRVKSFLGDINKAFLSGEKQSIAAEAAQPNNPPAAKSPESTRLRRWIRMI